MEQLPDVIPRLVADFLPPADAINLGRTCQRLHAQIALTATRPRRILGKFFRTKRFQSGPRRGFTIPRFASGPVHSVVLSMNIRYCEVHPVRVFVVAENENQHCNRSARRDAFGGGRVVVSSSPTRLNRRLSIAFKPQPNESYDLWYDVVTNHGSVGLFMLNVDVQALVVDDASTCVGMAHDFLARSNTFSPWDEERAPEQTQFLDCMVVTILGTTRHLLTNGLPVPPQIASTFREYGISEEGLSLKLVDSIDSTWSTWREEHLLYVLADESDEMDDDSNSVQDTDGDGLPPLRLRDDSSSDEDDDSVSDSGSDSETSVPGMFPLEGLRWRMGMPWEEEEAVHDG